MWLWWWCFFVLGEGVGVVIIGCLNFVWLRWEGFLGEVDIKEFNSCSFKMWGVKVGCRFRILDVWSGCIIKLLEGSLLEDGKLEVLNFDFWVGRIWGRGLFVVRYGKVVVKCKI